MDGRCITDVSSNAYKLMQSARIEDGLYKIGDYVCIAISNHYGRVGDVYRITLSSDETFLAIHTDTKKSYELDDAYAHPDGSLIEFIVDTETLDPNVKMLGSLDAIYPGSIVKIERMD